MWWLYLIRSSHYLSSLLLFLQKFGFSEKFGFTYVYALYFLAKFEWHIFWFMSLLLIFKWRSWGDIHLQGNIFCFIWLDVIKTGWIAINKTVIYIHAHLYNSLNLSTGMMQQHCSIFFLHYFLKKQPRYRNIWGRSIWMPPFGRQTTGRCAVWAPDIWAPFRVMKKKQWSRQFLEYRWARTCSD